VVGVCAVGASPLSVNGSWMSYALPCAQANVHGVHDWGYEAVAVQVVVYHREREVPLPEEAAP